MAEVTRLLEQFLLFSFGPAVMAGIFWIGSRGITFVLQGALDDEAKRRTNATALFFLIFFYGLDLVVMILSVLRRTVY